MNKNILSTVFLVSLIFLSWFLTIFLGSEPYRLPENNGLIVPFLWSCMFIYLQGKNHFYIAINSYTIFLLMLFADRLNFGDMPVKVHMSYLLLSLFMVFSFVFIYQVLLVGKSRLASVFSFLITMVFYAIPLFYIIYAINFNAVITEDVFYAISQTSIKESIEFIGVFISPIWIGLTFILAILVGFLLLSQEKKEAFRIETSLLIFMITIFAALFYVSRDDIRLYKFAKDAVKIYAKELKLFHETQGKLSSGEMKFEANKLESGETYIVVIGESLNKKHMGIYGYMRDTTPLLSKIYRNGRLLVFDKAFSSHTHTKLVLSQSLTEANQLNKKVFYDSLSIINILNKANVDTYWITNQNLYGEWDNLVSVIAHQANHLLALNRTVGKRIVTQSYDGAVIDEVNKILSKESENNRVIFVHLMGNHSDYCSRFPREYKIFSGELKSSEFGKLSTVKNIDSRINCYDNSVLYNDYVVSSLIKSLENKSGVNGFLYFSDHADDVVEKLGHNSGMFTYSMTQIPLIMWFSEQYKIKYRDKYNIIMNNKHLLFSNDNIYDTLIGIFNIYSERYQLVNDLSSSEYLLEDSHAYTLHGKIAYTDKSNYFYQQKNNIEILKDSNQALRVIPHRVNSIGKLKDIWFDGNRAFEVDVVFGVDGTERFKVGHNHGVMSGISFDRLIAIIPPQEIKKIWMDFKNLTHDNYKMALDRLNRLDDQFMLKEKLIVESGTTGSFFKEFQEAGWHISYYLPTDKVVRFLEEDNISGMKRLAKNIIEQSVRQNISAISFDHRLYPFVKNHLEPMMSDEIVYHTWDLSVKFSDKDLYIKLNEKKYFIDDRVKTILLPYKSLYDL